MVKVSEVKVHFGARTDRLSDSLDVGAYKRKIKDDFQVLSLCDWVGGGAIF